MQFPVWSKAISAQGTVKVTAGCINIDVVCGGALVSPGDVIVADYDGVVVVPRLAAENIAEKGEQRRLSEEKTREALRGRALSLDVHGLRGKLKELGVEYL